MNNTESPASGAEPHRPLLDYYQSPPNRAPWVRQLFDGTAPDYDRVTRLMDFGTGPGYRRAALLRAGLGAGMRVVDVGTGTGLVAREAAHIVGDAALVTGVDPSVGMMQEARTNVPGMVLIEGGAERIPLPDQQADFLSMGYALRHVGGLPAAFAEFRRVLKPGGRLCILEITQPAGRLSRLLLRAYMRGIVPVLSRLVARHPDTPKLMRYYYDTIEACVPPDVVLGALRQAGFSRVERHVEGGLLSEYRAVR